MSSITSKLRKLFSYKLYQLIDNNVSLKTIKQIIHRLDYSLPGKGEISGKLTCADDFFSSANHGRTPLLIHIVKKRTVHDRNYAYNVFVMVIDAFETKESKCKDLINARDRNGWTALHWASVYGYKDMVKFLLEAGADVELRTKEGDTPLALVESQVGYAENKYTEEEVADFEKIQKMLTNNADKVDDVTPTESKPLFEETENTTEVPGKTQPGHKHFPFSKLPTPAIISQSRRSLGKSQITRSATRLPLPTSQVSPDLKRAQKTVKESQSRRKNKHSQADFTVVGGKSAKKTRRNRKSKK